MLIYLFVNKNIFNTIAEHTQFDERIDINSENDFNSNFDSINLKATEIENWINNLTLTNKESLENDVHESLIEKDQKREPLTSESIEKKIFNINQIATNSKLNSV